MIPMRMEANADLARFEQPVLAHRKRYSVVQVRAILNDKTYSPATYDVPRVAGRTVFFTTTNGTAAVLEKIYQDEIGHVGHGVKWFRRWKEQTGTLILDGIGSTEMLHIFISNRPGDVRYGTTGKPVPGYEVQLRNEDGSVVTGHNEIGDLYIQGPSSALMYWNNREKTRDTFQGVWTKSGDKYTRDPDGYYTYAGRNDDMLKVSGIYVSPFEVEATLVQHPAILEAAVIGKEDTDGLTKTKAFIVLKQGQTLTQDEVKAFVKERLAPYKYPRFIEFVAELPKTATGKIQRFRLRDLEKN